MANKNHQSAQLGMEQRILLYTSSAGFFGLHAVIYNWDVCGLNPDRYERECGRGQKLRLYSLFSFSYARVTQNTKLNLYTKI